MLSQVGRCSMDAFQASGGWGRDSLCGVANVAGSACTSWLLSSWCSRNCSMQKSAEWQVTISQGMLASCIGLQIRLNLHCQLVIALICLFMLGCGA